MSQRKPATVAFMLHGFFVDYLPRQRALSPHTLCSYRDSIKLLLQFLAERVATSPNSVSRTSTLRTSRHSCNTSKAAGIAVPRLAMFD
jgi:site-specific recombinase XerC